MTLKNNQPIGSGSANSKVKKNLTPGASAQTSTVGKQVLQSKSNLDMVENKQQGKPVLQSKSNLDMVENKQQGKPNMNSIKSTPLNTEKRTSPIGSAVVEVRANGENKPTENRNTYRSSGEGAKSKLEGKASQESTVNPSRLKQTTGKTNWKERQAGKGSPEKKPVRNAAPQGAMGPFGKQKEVVIAERIRRSKEPTDITEPPAPSFQDLQNLKERFINRLMLKGQKALARNIFLKALETLVKINLDNTKRTGADKSKRAETQLEKAEKGQTGSAKQNNLAGSALGKKGQTGSAKQNNLAGSASALGKKNQNKESYVLPPNQGQRPGAALGHGLWTAQPADCLYSPRNRTALNLFLKPLNIFWYTSIKSNQAAVVKTSLRKHTLRQKESGDNRQQRNMAYHLPKIRATTFSLQDDLFLRAIENVKPFIELKSKRVAGSTFKIPFQISSYRQYSLAVRWLILASRQRPERHMINKLAAELFDAANSRGHAIKKRIEMHRAAEANRAYLHFRW